MSELSLKEYFDALIAQERAIRDAHFLAFQRAVDKAEATMDKRLEAQKDVFPSKHEYKALVDRVGKLERSSSSLSGKVTMFGAIIIVLLSVLNLAVKWL